VLQVNPQEVPEQVAVAFAGGVQGVHDEPQVAVLVFDEQVPLQL
jgi:hypothetical protein